MSDRRLWRTAATITSPILTGDGSLPSSLLGSASITIRRSDGSLLYDLEDAVPVGDGTFSFQLNATDTATLDILTVDWMNVAVGTTTSTVEIVGGFLFTVPDFQASLPTNISQTMSPGQIEDMRDTVEDALERYTGALVPRYAIETVRADTRWSAQITNPYVRAIRSVTVDGTALTIDQFTDLRTDVPGFLYSTDGWPTRSSTVTVGYEYGRDRPPPDMRRAGTILARAWLYGSAVDDRATTFASAEGGTYALAVAGRNGSLFGVPDVDAAVRAHMLPAVG